MATVSLPQFVAKWAASTRTERAAAQEHYIDLCRLLGQPTPNEADPKGEFYAFEKGVTKTTGEDGFADVWYRGHFAWEYKGKRKDLKAAYQQLLLYREDLDNPPLLVVCDLDRFEIHTNFTDTRKHVFAFTLAELLGNETTATCSMPPLDVLRALFVDPGRLRPDQTAAQVAERAAAEFAELAERLRRRGADPHQAARFLMRLLFCLFAEDVGLLPRKLFETLVERTRVRPADFNARLKDLFAAMAHGGWFGVEDIRHFDGGLFADAETLPLTADDLSTLLSAAYLDWASVEPAIFGTLFERSLDPRKRAQIGAHYTSKADILMLVEPVLMAPLRRRWAEVQRQAGEIVARRDAATTDRTRTAQQNALRTLLLDFDQELANIRVLDPACGSGNFLYVALKRLLDLEKEVIAYAAASGLGGFFPQVGPEQLHGIEIDVYAHELASVVVWIGYIQWLNDNGFGVPSDPILKPLHTIEQKDAVLAFDAAGKPVEPDWPAADVIIGNPPFLGDKRMRAELGDEYVEALRRLYAGRVPGGADLVTYWFEKARALILAGRLRRAGLLATQKIRAGANRKVLQRIKQSGDIFLAWSDREWTLEGATVHVSLVGFDNGSEAQRLLNGELVSDIHADLTAGVNAAGAARLAENQGLSFLGMMKAGPFDIDGATARRMLAAPVNPNGRPNADVVKRRIGAQETTGRPRDGWVIDFGDDLPEAEAALYEAPFEYIRTVVKPIRIENRRERTRRRWWLFGETRPGLRRAIQGIARCIVTPEVSKHRVFVWMETSTIPDHTLHVIARGDDYFFGVLHSRVHELWARRTGTQLREAESGFRYSSSTTFETFPFPWAPGQEPTDDPRVGVIGQVARSLVQLRDRWLNPPDASEAELKQRTLTALYNQRPAWLDGMHRALDDAVLDAYGWPRDLADEEILARLLALNLEREPAGGRRDHQAETEADEVAPPLGEVPNRHAAPLAGERH